MSDTRRRDDDHKRFKQERERRERQDRRKNKRSFLEDDRSRRRHVA